MPNPDRPTPRAAARRAFTLIELMVSMAMVLVIILGVNAIFKMASDTVNAGQSLAAANRENRAAQSVLYDDFRTAVITDGPMLLIRSERVSAFRNLADQLADRDYDPTQNAAQQDAAILTTDLDGNNTEGEPGVRGELTRPLVYNSRNHRIDRVSFFGRTLYRRQTGTESGTYSSFVDDGTSFEAYHWYGHLNQPGPGADPDLTSRPMPMLPGEKPVPPLGNPNNFYATDWILGRSITLLSEDPNPTTVPPNPNPPNYIAYEAPSQPIYRLRPLAPNSVSARPDARGVNDYLATSRYDFAHTSINMFRNGRTWSGVRIGGLAADATAFGVLGKSGGAAELAWWEIMGGSPLAGMPVRGEGRFQGYPYPDKPLTPYGVARTTPAFVRGCTQFVVEFAGDYLQQDPTNGQIVGSYLGSGTDGEIDYMYVVEQTHPTLPAQSVRRVRWYGMPRNVDLRDDATGPVITGGPAAASKHGNLYDVIPLRDLLSLAPGFAGLPADHFEHFVDLPAAANYAASPAVAPNYYAAWGPADLTVNNPRRPKMLRVTMVVDDPAGRMTDGQTFEYVIDLQ